MKNKIKIPNEIVAYFHCNECIKEWEKLKGISPQEYQKVQAGWTKKGFQVVCVRHDLNIIHIDFQGQKHLAETAGWREIL